MKLSTVEEILAYADDNDLYKNCCVNGRTSEFCKDLITQLPQYFVSIFNSLIISQLFPKTWGKGTVIVIPKSGDLSSPSNWRPIT